MSNKIRTEPALTGVSGRLKQLPHIDISSLQHYEKFVLEEEMNEFAEPYVPSLELEQSIKKCVYKYDDKLNYCWK
jgi:hypothetical protein